MLIDWLAAGLNPGVATLFVQSQVPEHAELHLLLSMITPLGWLERVPSYKDQQEELKEKDLATYGFLGYPLLQTADILLYRPAFVPVGEDQVAHVEITREVARRFNHLYGREPDFEAKAENAIKQLGGRNSTMYKQLRKKFQENGDQLALEKARAVVDSNTRLTVADRERLLGYLEGGSVSILPEPHVLLTATPKVPGLDGRKMSKSYGNTIGLREDPDEVAKKLKHDADRSGARAPHGSGQSGYLPGVRSAQDLFERGDSHVGGERLPHGRHRLPRVQEAADRQGGRRDRRHPQARAGIRGESRAGAQHRRRRRREGARCGARHARRRASRHEPAGGLTMSSKKAARPELRMVVDNSDEPRGRTRHAGRVARAGGDAVRHGAMASPSRSCRRTSTSRRRRSRCSSKPSRARSTCCCT